MKPAGRSKVVVQDERFGEDGSADYREVRTFEQQQSEPVTHLDGVYLWESASNRVPAFSRLLRGPPSLMCGERPTGTGAPCMHARGCTLSTNIKAQSTWPSSPFKKIYHIIYWNFNIKIFLLFSELHQCQGFLQIPIVEGGE